MRAAIEVALRRGHKIDDIVRVIPAVVAELPDRRFQIIWPASPSIRTFEHSEHSNNSLPP